LAIAADSRAAVLCVLPLQCSMSRCHRLSPDTAVGDDDSLGPGVAETLGKASLDFMDMDIVEDMGKGGNSKELFVTSRYVPGSQGIRASVQLLRSPLWSSGQSSWLQIRRPGFDSRHYQKKNVVGLERTPFSLVSTTEELLFRKPRIRQ
jgi:hypothetical protein